MKITELIEQLQNSLEEGFEYVSTDGMGGCSWTTSKTSLHNFEENLVYVTIFNQSVHDEDKDFEDLVEGKDFAHIKCKVLSTNIQKFDEDLSDMLECLFDVEPVEKLPEWYVSNEEDFNDIDILDINRKLQTLKIEIQGL